MKALRTALEWRGGVALGVLVSGLVLTLNAHDQRDIRQLQTLQEHPTEKAKSPGALPPGPSSGVLVGSCTLEDGTEVDVYTVVKQ